MNSILQENKELKEAIQKYEAQNKHLRHTNNEHESQIQNLLNFNQRLLSIIQSQFQSTGNKEKPMNIQQQQRNIPQEKKQNTIEINYMSSQMNNLQQNSKKQNKHIIENKNLMVRSDIVNDMESNNLVSQNKKQKAPIKRLASLQQKSQLSLAQSIKFQKKQNNKTNSQNIQDIRKLISMYRAEAVNVPGCHDVEPMCVQMKKQFEGGFQQYYKIATDNLQFYQNKMIQLQALHKNISQLEPIKRLQKFLEKKGRLTKK